MSSMGYVTIEGDKQGHIEGSGQHAGEVGLIEIFSFDHEVAVPRKDSAGLTAGRPVHQEILIGKLVDRSTPKLYQALCQRERLTEVIFEWYEYDGAGIEQLNFSITLSNAVITRIQPSMPDFLDPDQDRYRFIEHVGLGYETILWSWGNGDVQFESVGQSDIEAGAPR